VNENGKYQEHEPYSIGYYVKCSYDDSLSYYRSYRGKDCIRWFTQELKQFAENVETVFLNPLPMDQLNSQQIRDFNFATICHICGKPFSSSDEKVRDHCHLTGKYRGPAHGACNINYKDGHVIPVIFHNLSGYDAHFIIKNIALDFDGRVDLLPVNKENYISFTKHIDNNIVSFRFLDSFRFLPASLDTLSSYLTDFSLLKEEFTNLTDEQLKLLQRKGVFPYDFIDSVQKLEYHSLPDISDFNNKLNKSKISKEDYAHAQKVWEVFNCNNLGDYGDLYLKTDILLLAIIFESFRFTSIKTYSLDPAHYFTLPGYTWDCMLKYTGVQLDLLTDIDQILFIERGIRGGLSQCSKRYVKANNKYLDDFNSSKDSSYLIYLDINNQYGWGMSNYLPTGGFEWVKDFTNFDVMAVADDSDTGYILEVDLEYPSELHKKHNDLPFCPEHFTAPGSKDKKLMATLHNKQRYVIHYRNLKQALNSGLKLTKIHRILSFEQSAWLKKYIDLNTKLRAEATNDFEKNLYKLQNNACFGKSMEAVRIGQG